MCGRRAALGATCGTHGTFKIDLRCNHALCPECSRKRARQVEDRWSPLLPTFVHPGGRSDAARRLAGKSCVRMWTLTRISRDGEGLEHGLDELLRIWRRFATLLRNPPDGVVIPEGLGGVRSLEVVPKGKGRAHWHLHVAVTHKVSMWAVKLLWAVAQLDRRTKRGRRRAQLLQQLAGKLACERGRDDSLTRWAAACRSSGRVAHSAWVSSVELGEVFKYICKAPWSSYKVRQVERADGSSRQVETGWTDAALVELVELLAGRRLRRVAAFGSLYGAKLEADDDDELGLACPLCGCGLTLHTYERTLPMGERAPPRSLRWERLVVDQLQAGRRAAAREAHQYRSASVELQLEAAVIVGLADQALEARRGRRYAFVSGSLLAGSTVEPVAWSSSESFADPADPSSAWMGSAPSTSSSGELWN